MPSCWKKTKPWPRFPHAWRPSTRAGPAVQALRITHHRHSSGGGGRALQSACHGGPGGGGGGGGAWTAAGRMRRPSGPPEDRGKAPTGDGWGTVRGGGGGSLPRKHRGAMPLRGRGPLPHCPRVRTGRPLARHAPRHPHMRVQTAGHRTTGTKGPPGSVCTRGPCPILPPPSLVKVTQKYQINTVPTPTVPWTRP